MEPSQFWKEILSAVIRGERNGPIKLERDTEPIVRFGQQKHLLELLSAYGFENDLPEDLLRESKKQRSRTVVRNRIFRDLMDTIEQKCPPSLDLVWLKGAEVISRDDVPAGVRRLSDLDLLIRKEQLPGWYELFGKLGFEAHRPLSWLEEETFSSAVSSTFFNGTWKNQEILLDVHWHLVDFPARRASGHWDFDIETVWNRASGKTLSPQDRVIYRLDHALTHNFYQWKFILDLWYIGKDKSLEYDDLRSRAEELNLDDSFETAVGFLNVLFGQDRLEWLVKGVEPLKRSETDYFQRVLDGQTRKGEYLAWCFDRMNSTAEKYRFLLFILSPPAEAIPGVQTKPGLCDRLKIYGARWKRVIREGGRIFGLRI